MKTFLDRDLIVIDVESNGLYGQPFCVGAVHMDCGGRVLSRFLWRCGLDQVEDEYVLEHVMPAIQHIKEMDNLADMEKAFIEWYATVLRDNRAHTIVDVGFPVDGGFLYRLGSRNDNHGELWRSLAPYPLYDLSSILAGLGVDPDVSREEFAAPLIGVAVGTKHNPAWDAELTGLCVIRAMRPVLEMAQR